MSRVVIVGPTFPYKGGVAQHTTQLAFQLREVGIDTELLSWKAQYPERLYPGDLEVAGGEGEPFPATRRELAWYDPIGWITSMWRRRSVDTLVLFCLVNVIQVVPYLVMALVARRGGATVGLVCHNVVPHDAPAWQRWAVRALFGVVPNAIVHSPAEAEAAAALGARRVEEVTLPYFLPVPPEPAESREPTGSVLFFGFVRPYKGLDVLIDALALCTAPVTLRVVGEFWDSLEKYEAQARRSGVAARVVLEDRYLASEELAALLVDTDALVVPYRTGTGSQHPRVGHLAGLPVIVSDAGDLPLQVVDGVDGFVCAAEDAVALADAIDRLYEPGVIERMRTWVREHPPEDDWPPYVGAVRQLIPFS